MLELFLLKFYVFISVYLLLAVLGLHCCAGFSLVAARRGYCLVGGAWTSHCSGFSCCGAWALECVGSVVVAPGL